MADLALGPPIAATLLAIFCGLTAIALSGGGRTRWLVPLSGVLIAGVAVLGLIPELCSAIGWWRTFTLAAFGYAGLALLEFKGYPVCPSCSHGEKFSSSLVVATGVHALMDGWGMAATRGQQSLRMAIAAAILIHKIPEGFALGTLLRLSSSAPASAGGLLLLAETPTLLGGFLGLHTAPGLWVNYPLAVVSGTFLFLGLHAIRNWAKLHDSGPAGTPARK